MSLRHRNGNGENANGDGGVLRRPLRPLVGASNVVVAADAKSIEAFEATFELPLSPSMSFSLEGAEWLREVDDAFEVLPVSF